MRVSLTGFCCGILRSRLSSFLLSPVTSKKLLAFFFLIFFLGLSSCVAMQSGTSSRSSEQARGSAQTVSGKAISYGDHLRLGAIYESNGNLRPALREYERARAMKPRNSRPYFGIGNIQLRNGDLDAAEKSYKKAIRRHSKIGLYYNNLAWVYIKTQRYADAYSMAARGEALDSRRRYIYLDTIGVIEMRLGNYSQAEQKLKEAVALMPLSNRKELLGVYENLHELYTKMMMRTEDIIEVERRINELKGILGSTVPMLP
jgi:tetratricopeptide (TPR) repeat protein